MSNEIKTRKIYDLDAAFDKRIGEYMKKNKGRFTEEEWEDKIPELYRKFSTTHVAVLGTTPEEYYSRMNEEEFSAEIKAHFDQGVAIDGFLRAAAEEEKNLSVMLSLLDGSEEEELFAIQVLGANERAVDKYVDKLCSDDALSEKVLGEIVDILSEREMADALCGKLLQVYPDCLYKDCIENILCNVSEQTDAVYDLLINAFRVSDEPGVAAERLAQYGDYRALPVLMERAKSEDCGYGDWRSIKYAVESMGEKLPARDFTADKDFIRYTNEEARLQSENEELK